MADSPSSYPQRLVSETTSSKQQTQQQQEEKNPSKFYSHFFSKSFLVAILLVLLPLFPSQAPDFINQTLLTRSWELVHLLFVGIAVSYGLFSRRNVDTEKENQTKIDNTQTYVSRILQVSSVFDDEIEPPSGSNSTDDSNKIQTWNSQYFRGNPMVLVADTNPVIDEQQQQQHSIRTTTTRSSSSSSEEKEKPLLLPVRSLRSQVSNTDSIKSINELGGSSSSSGSGSGSGSVSRSGSGLKAYASSNSFRKSGNGEIQGLDPLVLEEKLKESTVLPSPIPWRSRSGRMEMKEEMGVVTPPLYSLPPSMGGPEFDRVDSFSRRSSSIKLSSQPNSNSASPRKLSPSPSLSPEIRAKNVEDLVKKKSFYKSSPPPPPPPPPPPVIRKSPLINSSLSTEMNDGFQKNFKTSFKNELKDFSKAASRMDLDSMKAEAKSRSNAEGSLSSMGRSVRTIRPNEQADEVTKTRETDHGKTGKQSKEVEATLAKRTGRKAEEYPSQIPAFSKYPKDEKDVFEKVLVDSDEEYNTDSDSAEECTDTEETSKNGMSNIASPKMNAAGSSANVGADADAGTNNPNEVDKKADEFIAKFREQIRLQRIESIKKTSGKYNNRNSSR